MDFLKKVPLLQGLDSGTLQRVADALKRVEFAAGSKIVTEGEPGDDFYLIEDGEVKCTKRNGSEEQHLLTLKRGDYFGEMVSCGVPFRTRRRACGRLASAPRRHFPQNAGPHARRAAPRDRDFHKTDQVLRY